MEEIKKTSFGLFLVQMELSTHFLLEKWNCAFKCMIQYYLATIFNCPLKADLFTLMGSSFLPMTKDCI
jgi:hypothetical protein